MKFINLRTEYARQDPQDRQEPLGILDIRDKKGPLERKDHQAYRGLLELQAWVAKEDLQDLKE